MLNPSFSRGEYWLLETVVELSTPLHWLASENLELLLNKAGHGMSTSLLLDTLDKLSHEELINFHGSRDEEAISLTREELSEALLTPKPDQKSMKQALYYRLTDKGGQYWEAFSRPNWSYFIDAISYHEESETEDESSLELIELVCMDEERLELIAREVKNDEKVMTDTIKTDVLKPWQATYWKELPKGHRVRFTSKVAEGELLSTPPAWQEHIDIDRLWYAWG